MTTNENIAPGTKVRITVSEASPFLACAWWPQGEVTGTVEKVFKNGNVSVAVDQIRNRSEDRRRSLNFNLSELEAR